MGSELGDRRNLHRECLLYGCVCTFGIIERMRAIISADARLYLYGTDPNWFIFHIDILRPNCMSLTSKEEDINSLITSY